MELKMAFHSVTSRRIVEVFDNRGQFIAAIYPNEETNGIKIVSKYIATFDLDDGSRETTKTPSIDVKFMRLQPQDLAEGTGT